MRHPAAIFAAFLLCFAASAMGKNLTIRGYVTAVESPTRFEMDKYKIIDATEAERQRLGIKPGKKDNRAPQLKPGTLRVGLEVEVKGDYDPKTDELHATGIRSVYDDSDPGTPIESIGLVEDNALQKNAQGWSGRLTADGETIVLTSDTSVSVKRSRTERKELQDAGHNVDDDTTLSPGDIDLDTFAEYVGVRQSDHSILAKKLVFRQDRVAPASEWSLLDPVFFIQTQSPRRGN